jgi:hypothetical protein
MIRLPTLEKVFSQDNTSDLSGNVFVTKNITFDAKGYMQLSNATPAMYSQANDANFDEVAAFCRCDDYGYFAGTHDSPYEIDADRPYGVIPAEIVDAGAVGCDLQGDAVFFGDSMIVSQDNDVDYYTPSTNTWTDTNISLTSTAQSQHPLKHFLSLNALAVANVNGVALYEFPISATPTPFASGGVNSAVVLPSNFFVTGMTYFNDNLYIGTMNRQGGKAALYVWDGTGTAAQSVYEVDSVIIWDVVTYQDSVVIITGTGALLSFNGSGFTKLAGLPIYYTERKMADETNIAMFKNCLKPAGDLLYINWSSAAYDLHLNDQPDGIWCYDPSIGMYHRYSLSGALAVYDTITTADVNTGTDVITVTAAPITGTECLYNAAGTAIAGLVDGQKYYVINLTSTTIKLASTLANAIAGTAIDLTGTGNSSQVLTFFPRTDFGQKYNDRVTALLPIERIIENPDFGIDTFWSGSVASRTTSGTGIMGCTTPVISNRGYFISPKILSTEVTDNFNKVNLKFTPFKDESDTIIIKYRNFDDNNVQQQYSSSSWRATWTSTTTFTTTEDLSAFTADPKTNQYNYEVEFAKGAASGYMMQISNIAEAAGVYTVTLDEAYPYYESGDSSDFIIRNWTKWKTIAYGSSDANQSFLNDQLGVDGKFLQIKLELRGVGVRIEELLINNVTSLPAK